MFATVMSPISAIVKRRTQGLSLGCRCFRAERGIEG